MQEIVRASAMQLRWHGRNKIAGEPLAGWCGGGVPTGADMSCERSKSCFLFPCSARRRCPRSTAFLRRAKSAHTKDLTGRRYAATSRQAAFCPFCSHVLRASVKGKRNYGTHGVNFGHTLAQLGDRSWSHPCHKTAGWFTSQHFLC